MIRPSPALADTTPVHPAELGQPHAARFCRSAPESIRFVSPTLAPALLAIGVALTVAAPASAQLYWRTDGTSGQTWTGANWNDGSATATGGTGWTSGGDAVFSADATLTFVDTTAFSSLTVDAGYAVTITAAGTAAAGAHTIDVGAGATLTWTGEKFKNSSLVKNGAGTWDLGTVGASFAVSEGFTLNAGTLIFSSGNALGTATSAVTINGGTIQVNGAGNFKPTTFTIGGDFGLKFTSSIVIGPWDNSGTMALGSATRTITVDNNGDSNIIANINTTISGATGTGLIFTGPGKVSLNNSGSTYDGGTTISGGADVAYAGTGSFGTGDITLDGGTLRWENGAADISDRLVMGAAGGSVDIGSAAQTFAGVITGTGGLTQSGAGGVLTLAAANTYSGTTTVNAGTLVLSNALAIQNSALNTGSAGAITLSSVTTPTFGGLTGSTDVASVITSGYAGVTALTLNPNAGATHTYAGVIADGAAGMTLTKTGDGTQILTGANTYTGATTISGGTLAVNGSLAAASTVTVASGGTLGGSGTINGAATVQSGGSLAPGNSPGLLTFANGLTLDDGSMSLFQIEGTDRGATYDAIDVTGGTLLYGGTLTLNFGTTIADSTTLDLFDLAHPAAGSFTSIAATSSYVGAFSNSGGTWTLSVGGQLLTFVESTGDLTFSAGSAVPEPATSAALLGGLALAGTALGRRRRRPV